MIDTTYLDLRTEFYRSIFLAVEEVLAEHSGDDSIQLPALIKTVILDRVKGNVSLIKEMDPFIRDYIRNHPIYESVRGVKGGVRKRKVGDTKQKAKQEVMQEIDSKLAASTTVECELDTDACVSECETENSQEIDYEETL